MCFNALAGIFAFRTQVDRAEELREKWFQCPRGHFCFSDAPVLDTSTVASCGFQCPRGHFCFSDQRSAACRRARHSVSMPSRAFLLFGRQHHCIGRADREGFQCPRGHFCFSDHRSQQWGKLSLCLVSMPSRAFLLFGPTFAMQIAFLCVLVSMPARAFLLFGHIPLLQGRLQSFRFQCPRGHFCFSDNSVRNYIHIYLPHFNAREGIFAFRTRGSPA